MYPNMYSPTDVFLIGAPVLFHVLGIVNGITPDEHTRPTTFTAQG